MSQAGSKPVPAPRTHWKVRCGAPAGFHRDGRDSAPPAGRQIWCAGQGVRGRVCGAGCAGRGLGASISLRIYRRHNHPYAGMRGRVRGGEGFSIRTLSAFKSRDSDGKCAGRVCRLHSRAVGVCGPPHISQVSSVKCQVSSVKCQVSSVKCQVCRYFDVVGAARGGGVSDVGASFSLSDPV